jgi:hypothetical protein
LDFSWPGFMTGPAPGARLVTTGIGSPDRGPSGSLRLARTFGPQRFFSVDAGINAALADEGFVSSVVGMELRAWPRRRLSPFVRLEGGALFEESQSYVALGAGGGLAARLGPSLSLRASAVWCDHGGGEGGGGPHVFQIGLERRW